MRTTDGCRLFVSFISANGSGKGLAILKRAGGRVDVERFVRLKDDPTGLVLTHDGKLLIAAAGDNVLFFDPQHLIGDPPKLKTQSGAGDIYVNVTADDKLLFVSQERAKSIAVIDLEKARAAGYNSTALIGTIPTGIAPIALTFSPDGKWLYTTAEGAVPDWNWPKACKPEGRDPAKSDITRPEGAVVVIDVAKAKSDPANAVVARVPAGCSPVRMAIAPGGDRIYVTARNSNAVLAFDASKLISDPGHARTATVPVGSAPVPIAVVNEGTKIIVGNSNRFGAKRSNSDLTVIDTAKMDHGEAAVLGTIPAGEFPREMSVSADHHTLFLTNFGSKSLQIIDLDRLLLK